MSNTTTEKTRPRLLPAEALADRRVSIDDAWELVEGNTLRRVFRFKGYYRTIAFVNAVAWIAQQHNHHPDLGVTYNTCTVTYTTHDAGGLTELDFTCIRKIDALEP